MKYLPLIWAGIWRKRGRSILMLLQITVAFTLFGVLQGVKSGIEAAIHSIAADLLVVISDSGGGAPLPLAQFARIQSVAGVRSVTRESFMGGTYQKPTQRVAALATDIGTWESVKKRESADFTLTVGATEAMARTRNGTLVGNKLAARYGWKVGDHIPLESPLTQQGGSRNWEFEVVGIFVDPLPIGYSELLVINYDYFNEARVPQKNTVQRYIVELSDPASAVAVGQAIDRLFINSSDETRSEALSDLAQSQFQQIGDMNFVIRAVIAAVMFALLFSTTTMTMQSIRERTPELAVLKTLGFSDRTVFVMVLAEVTTLCLVAAALGMLLASRVIPLMARFTNIDVKIPSAVLLAGLGIAIGLSAVSAALPARRALRLQVAEALAGR